MENFYTYQDELVRGPFSREKLLHMIASGHIEEATPLSLGRDTPWRPLAEYPELLEEAAAAKPPAAANKIRFLCPYCGQPYQGDAAWIGREIACRSCRRNFTAAAPGGTVQDVPAPSPATMPKSVESAPVPTGEIPEGDIICPHCWQKFDSEYLLYVAQHPTLIGDPVLGPNAKKRFAPSSFNALGQALDATGTPCTELACPRCHLSIPASVIEEPSRYFSIVGAPSSGKTYYLTALLYRLRQVLAAKFACSLLDVDPQLNAVLNSYENSIFWAARRDRVAILLKTELQGDAFFDTVLLDEIPVQLPKPFVFELRSQLPGKEDVRRGLNLVFYDNAGEHFQPGADKLENPGTRHLGCSDGIVFLFDPLNDAIMRADCDSGDPQLATDEHVYDQSILLAEMIGRIRKHRNLNSGEKCPIPLVIAVGKYDAWKNVFEKNIAALDPIEEKFDDLSARWNRNMVMDVSFALRELMLRYAPGLVHTAEAFFEEVTFVPFSSFGCLSKRSESGQPGVIPSEINPTWVEQPLLMLLGSTGLIEEAPPPEAPAGSRFPVRVLENFMVFSHPRDRHKVRLPAHYGHTVLTIDGKPFALPAVSGTAGGGEGQRDDLWS